jgi:hypothetical protein
MVRLAGPWLAPPHTRKRFTMYVKAQIVRVAASSDKCSCGGTMTATVRIAE